MNINKSKVTLAAKIKSSGFEWPQFGKWATQDKDGKIFISGGDFTPVRMSGEVNWEFDAPYKSAGKVEVGLNWFQCILSRAEYFHLYPAPGADEWIEWNGGKCPVDKDARIDIRMTGGTTHYDTDTHWGWNADSFKITHYRLHKPEQAKTELRRSVVQPIAEPEIQSEIMGIAQVGDINVVESKSTIEQLAADYRNTKDYAERKQREADDAKDGADARLKALEIAAEDLGFKIEPITTKQDGL